MIRANGTVNVRSASTSPGKVLTTFSLEKRMNKGMTNTIAGNIWLVSIQENRTPLPLGFSQTMLYAAGVAIATVIAAVIVLMIRLFFRCGAKRARAVVQF